MRRADGASIDEVVDLVGDGRPELLVREGSETEPRDLADTSHQTMAVPYFHDSCGC